MKAVILAAGYATRLYPLTLDKPKCLLNVGGRTILDSICDKLNALPEVDEIILVTNARFFEPLSRWKDNASSRISIRVLNDGTHSNQTRLGAVGDLELAIQKAPIDSDFLLLASDNLFDQDLGDFIKFAGQKKDRLCISVYDIGDPALAAGKFGVVEAGPDGRVLSMEEKPLKPKSSLIGMGLYFFPKALIGPIRAFRAGYPDKDAPGFLISWIFEKHPPVYSFQFKGMWYDIGDLNALEEANKIFTKK